MQAENNIHTRQQHTILNSLARGASRTEAAAAAGISRRTLYHWMDRDSSFREAVEDAEEETIDIARSLAFSCAMRAQENPRYLRALFFYLKCKAGWSDRPPRQHATVSPDLVNEVATEVIRSLQTLGLIPATPIHPDTTTPAKPPDNHVQCLPRPCRGVQTVQSPTDSPPGHPGPTRREEGLGVVDQTSEYASIMHATSATCPQQPTTDNEKPTNNVQCVQQPTPSPASSPTPTTEQPTTNNGPRTKPVQSVQPSSQQSQPKRDTAIVGLRSAAPFQVEILSERLQTSS